MCTGQQGPQAVLTGARGHRERGAVPAQDKEKSMTDIDVVTQTVLLERQGRDRGWWDQMRACYWPDSTVTLSWYRGDGPGFVDASEAMTGRGEASMHRLSAPTVQIVADRAPSPVSRSSSPRSSLPPTARRTRSSPGTLPDAATTWPQTSLATTSPHARQPSTTAHSDGCEADGAYPRSTQARPAI